MYYSHVAPCPLGSQMPVFVGGSSGVSLLLEGERRGEIWAGPLLDGQLHAGRVATSLAELFDHLATLTERQAEAEEQFEDPFMPLELWPERFPGINSFLATGTDVRPQAEIAADDGWSEAYVPEASPESDGIINELIERQDRQSGEARRWRERHFPGQRPVPPTT